MEEDVFDRKTARLREQQHKCTHPSWVCPLCRLYKDNVKDEQRLKIIELEKQIAEYEQMFIILGFYLDYKFKDETTS